MFINKLLPLSYGWVKDSLDHHCSYIITFTLVTHLNSLIVSLELKLFLGRLEE